MVLNFGHWIFRQKNYLLLIAGAVYVASDNSTDNCNFHTSLHQSFRECTIAIEAMCFNTTTAQLIDSQDVSSLLQRAVLQIYTAPINWANYSSLQLHYLSNLMDTQSNTRWYVSLPESVMQLEESLCVRTSLTITEDNATIVPLRDTYCINHCIQSEEAGTNACEGMPEGLCLEVSTTHNDANDMMTIIVTDGLYYTREYSSDSHSWNTPTLLPSCLPVQNVTTLYRSPHWLYYNNSNHDDNCSLFVPTNIVYSRAGTFIVGNDGLIFSIGMENFYVLQLPKEANVSSFQSLSTEGGQFAFIVTFNQIVSLYYGLVGFAEVLQIDNGELQTILNYWNSTQDDIVSIEWNTTNHIMHITLSDNTSLSLPIVSLITKSWEIYTSTIEHIPVTPSSPYPFSTSLYHELFTQSLQSSRSYYKCPFSDVVITAQVCSVYTRTIFSLQDNYSSNSSIYNNSTQLSLAYNDCNITVDWLPWNVYLPFDGSYNFSLNFQLQVFDPSSLFMSSKLSQNGAIKLTLLDSFDPTENTKSYNVIIKDSLLMSSLQVESGLHVAMTTVTLQVWNSGLSCISNSSGPMKIHNPGFYDITVRVGCPPGLQFLYDTEESIGHEQQYCKQEKNLSCHFFDNDYRPVFKVLDEVTGLKSTYNGKYSLRALAGGTSPNNMRPFDISANIESTIWTTSTNYYSNVTVFDKANNEIIWICSQESPCGDVLPRQGGTPEYCLLLEASNLGVGANTSYCHFSVQFTICIHAIRMGLAGVISSFLVSILLFSIVLTIGFVVWFWKINFKGYSIKEKSQVNKEENKFKKIREMIKCHKIRVEEETTNVEETIE